MDVKVIIIVVLLLIVCIGGYLSIKQFIKNNRENSFATVLFSNGMLLIVSSSSSFDKVLVGVGVIAQYDNAVSLAGEFNMFYFILGCALILLSVAMHLYSRKLYVLNINGYSNMRLNHIFQQ